MDGDVADYSGIDIISSLPNEILCHILSFLPTKYAVGTCILSTRWKNLFPLSPQLRLHLDDTFLLHPESAFETTAISFMNFSRRLLNVTLHDVTSIYSLGLVCIFFNDGQEVANWVCAALRLKVKKLTLCTHQLHNPSFLFDSLYGCNIVSLSLFLDFADSIPECRFSLPNLNKLFVHRMKYNVVNALIASCPSLECLIVQNCFCFPREKLQICSSSLKGLKLVNCIYSLEGEIEIDAPKLEFLGHGGFFASRYLIRRLKSLQAARFDLDQNTVLNPFLLGAPAMELVKALLWC